MNSFLAFRGSFGSKALLSALDLLVRLVLPLLWNLQVQLARREAMMVSAVPARKVTTSGAWPLRCPARTTPPLERPASGQGTSLRLQRPRCASFSCFENLCGMLRAPQHPGPIKFALMGLEMPEVCRIDELICEALTSTTAMLSLFAKLPAHRCTRPEGTKHDKGGLSSCSSRTARLRRALRHLQAEDDFPTPRARRHEGARRIRASCTAAVTSPGWTRLLLSM